MAEQEVTIVVAKVHAVALAVAEEVAVGTGASAHPLAVAIGLEAVLPHIHEVVAIDIALMVIATDAGTG